MFRGRPISAYRTRPPRRPQLRSRFHTKAQMNPPRHSWSFLSAFVSAFVPLCETAFPRGSTATAFAPPPHDADAKSPPTLLILPVLVVSPNLSTPASPRPARGLPRARCLHAASPSAGTHPRSTIRSLSRASKSTSLLHHSSARVS